MQRSVLRAGRFRFALDEMKLGRLERAEVAGCRRGDRIAQLFGQSRRVEVCQGQMRRECPFFAPDANILECSVNIFREAWQIRGGVQSGPKHLRVLATRKKSQPSAFDIDEFIHANICERSANCVECPARCFADEFERHVEILLSNPARRLTRSLRRQFAQFSDQSGEIVSHGGRNLQRDKEPHVQARAGGCLPL